MRNRIVAAAVALAVAVLGACTPRPQTPLASTASVTVNGNDAKFQIVKCTQVEWYRTIDIGGDFSGAKVVVDGRAEPRQSPSPCTSGTLGGFTGMYSQGDGRRGQHSSLSGGKLHDHRYGPRLQGRQIRTNRQPPTFKIASRADRVRPGGGTLRLGAS